MRKRQSALSLSEEAFEMVEAIRAKLGVSRNAMIEILIRERAGKEGIKIEKRAEDRK